jgi:hypothetical protein
MAVMEDAFPTRVSFGTPASMKWRILSVDVPGIDAGDTIDTTSMDNTAWRTAAVKQLKSLTDLGLTVAYDPAIYAVADLGAAIGVNQEFTITFPDDSTLKFWGAMRSFDPGDVSEGEQPEADVVIVPTLRNGSGAETAPVWAAAA